MSEPSAFRRHVRPSLLACAVASSLWLTTDAQATSVWITERTGALTLVLGEGSVDDAYDPSQVLKVTATDKDGKPVAVTVKPQAHNVVIEPAPGAAAVAVWFDDGLWAETPDGKWFSVSRAQARDRSIYKHRYMRYTTTILGPLSPQALGKPHGQKLEVVPLVDPLTLKKGDKLPVRVLMDGKPLAGATVCSDYVTDPRDEAAVTDRFGKTLVEVRNAALNVILAWYEDEEAEGQGELFQDLNGDGYSEGFTSTLAFTLPH